jgi:FMN phosphatase YigB (HAD superfamily)
MLNLLLTDYGGVLGKHHLEPAESRLAELLNVTVLLSRQLLSERSPQGRAFREDKISEVEFWDHVVALTPVAQTLDAARVAELSLLWAQTYALDEEVLAAFHRVRSKAKLGVLSNIDRARSRYLEDTVRIAELVDIYMPSYRFKAIKPSKELWRSADNYVRTALGPDVLITYVDDRETHVDACSEVGWRGVLYEDLASFELQLASLGFVDQAV